MHKTSRKVCNVEDIKKKKGKNPTQNKTKTHTQKKEQEAVFCCYFMNLKMKMLF